MNSPTAKSLADHGKSPARSRLPTSSLSAPPKLAVQPSTAAFCRNQGERRSRREGIRDFRRGLLPLALVVAGATALTGLIPSTAAAKPDRRGFQSDFLVGVSACLPGQVKCSAEGEVSGATRPHFGLGATLGFRPLKFLMVGAAYNLGFFNPKYARGGADVYRVAYQNSFFAVVRAILPIWRLDLGLELGPGFSRQTFRATDETIFTRVSSQGFALKFGPVVDIFLTKHFFVGGKVDFIVNFHDQVCTDGIDQARVCVRTTEQDQAAVHQVIGGLHLGSVF